MPKGPNTPSTHEHIKQYMEKEERVTTNEVYEEVKEWCEENGWTVPTKQSISKKFWMYNKLGLVKVVGEEESDSNLPVKKKVYEIKEEDSDKWERPSASFQEMKEA